MNIGKAFLAGIGVELDEAAAPASASISRPVTLPSASATISSASTGAATVDQGSVDALNQQIFPAADNYTLFRDLHQALGGNDVAHTLSILMKANPGISVPKIKTDIQMALDRVRQQRQQFGQEIDKAKKSRVDGAEAEIQRLTAKIAADNQQIVQMQADIATSQQQVSASQSQKQQAQAAISEGQAHFEAVVQTIEQPLQQAQSIFSTIQ